MSDEAKGVLESDHSGGLAGDEHSCVCLKVHPSAPDEPVHALRDKITVRAMMHAHCD
jgi:hypothetical protein